MVNFNDKPIPSFIVIGKIDNPILPPLSQNQTKISGRSGSISFGNEIEDRNIEMEISIIATNEMDLQSKIREFADWLYYDKPEKLILDDNADVYYMAQVTGSTNIEKISRVGQGTISFVCNDPCSYSIDEVSTTLNSVIVDGATEIMNFGQLDAYPKMEFIFSEPTTNFNIITENEVMTFGSSNVENTIKDVNPLVFHDSMTSGTGWATANYVESGVVTGNTFVSNGWSVSNANHGEGTLWHGSAGVKSIGTQLQDFKIGCEFGFNPYVGQIGRVQVYGLDINGNVICMLSTKNSDMIKPRPQAQVKIGNKFYVEQNLDDVGKYYSNGVLLPLIPGVTLLKRNDTGASVTKLQTSLKTLGFTIVIDGTFGLTTENVVKAYQTSIGIKNDGIAGKDTLANIQNSLSKIGQPIKSGRMDIARRGNKWSVYYAIKDSKGIDQTQILKTFTVANGGYEVNKLAQIQIHIGAWKDAETYPAVMEAWIGDLKVWNESPTLGNNEIPIIFKSGDILLIDSENDSIHLNGEPYYTSLDPSSQFPVLKKGNNEIVLSPLVTASGIIKFRERFW